VDRRGDATRPDDWCEKFNVYEDWTDAPVYVHALHKKILIRRERLNGGSRGWAIVDSADEERPHILYAAFTDKLSPPFAKRAWRAYKGSAPSPSCTYTTVAEFCEARRAEGNLAFAAAAEEGQRFPFDEAVAAEVLYTEAIEMFREDAAIGRTLKISLLLNRAENRHTLLKTAHRVKGWAPRDDDEFDRQKRDFVRDALRDCEDARVLAHDCPPDDVHGPPVDARPYVKTAKVKVALGDLDGATADLKTALSFDPAPKTRAAAAAVVKAIRAQRAKEKAFYANVDLAGIDDERVAA